MTTFPIIEQVAQALATLLEGVTEANNYNHDLASVQRPTRFGDIKAEHLAVVLTVEETEEDDEQPMRFKQWRTTFAIDLFIRPDDSSTDPVDQLTELVRGDIEKHIMTDETLGGLALYSTIRAPTGFVSDAGDFEGVRIRDEVVYRHLITDPTDQGS